MKTVFVVTYDYGNGDTGIYCIFSSEEKAKEFVNSANNRHNIYSYEERDVY